MNLFLASVYSSGYLGGTSFAKLVEREKQGVLEVRNVLESYHYIQKGKYVGLIRNDQRRVFLDSGAFSAHTLGVKMDLRKYVEFIKKNLDIIRKEDDALMASVLDGIGDPLKTWQNQLAMEDLGVRPLPCFHFGEDSRYLDWYVQRYSYITLGGMVGKRSEDLITWLDQLWERHLVDGSGQPRLKVHAFGITNETIATRYPWFSVDSAAWVQRAAFGMIVHPRWGNIFVSAQSPTRHKEGYHFTNLSRAEQNEIVADLALDGFDIERLSTVGESRTAYNLWAYNQVGLKRAAQKIERFTCEQPRLF
jgi:hypothetical protein